MTTTVTLRQIINDGNTINTTRTLGSKTIGLSNDGRYIVQHGVQIPLIFKEAVVYKINHFDGYNAVRRTVRDRIYLADMRELRITYMLMDDEKRFILYRLTYDDVVYSQ